MKLYDPANKVLVWDHVGPHPKEYHAAVWARLQDLLNNGGSLAQLKQLLQELAVECNTANTNLNDLLTK